MHMGEMKFKQRGREEQAECDGTAGKHATYSMWLLIKSATLKMQFDSSKIA